MARFVKNTAVSTEIESVFEDARKFLVIVSPFIRLHSRLKELLELNPAADHELQVMILTRIKSLSSEDLNFFKQFANIEIYNEPRLHAKYYANEKKAILSSMNLYEFSQDNNIEVGVVTKVPGFLQSIGEKITGAGDQALDVEAHNYFHGLFENRAPVYQTTPVFKKTMLGLSKVYSHPEVTIDLVTDQLSSTKTPKAAPVEKKKRVTPSKISGYCIRTGEAIPFNIEKPYTDKAFTSWNRFKNEDFSEKYCHYSGEPSEGNTTKAKPILSKNWAKAKKK
ncbi:hypothetical protein HOD02_03600 [bacterium]|nr:hypothetical protein [bacterium]